MPYVHAHALRLHDPAEFDTCRIVPDKFDAGVDAVFCKRGDGPMVLQSLRFDAGKFDADAARKWAADHGYSGTFEPAKKDYTLAQYITPVGAGLLLSETSEDVPRRRFRKELIRIGKYVKASDGVAFEVTSDVLDHWVREFRRFTALGNKVPVPLSHTAQSADANRGWVVDMVREGDSLYGIIELVGNDAATLAATSDVSIFCPPEHIDGHGNIYYRPITHVALCMDPVIPGLANFEPLAANATAYRFAETSIMPENESTTKLRDALIGLLGLPATASDDDVVAAVRALIGTKERTEAISASHASATNTTAPDPLMIRLATENRQNRLAALVNKGCITPAVHNKLLAKFASHDAIVLSLSRGLQDDFEAMCAILTENNPVALGEHTREQVHVLSSGRPGDAATNPILRDVARRRAEAGLPD